MISTVSDDPASAPSTLRTRPTLLFRLRDWQDEASWSEFYRLYHQFVFSCARRAGLAHADAEEVAQDVFKRVAETVHEFESDPARGSFRGWLLNLTRWRIADKFRARKPHENQPRTTPAPGDDRTGTIERLPAATEGDDVWEHEWRQSLLEAALARLARRVPAKQFQIFDLYRRQDWSVLRVARELGVNPATVYVVSHRLTKQLKAEVARLSSQVG
ncbi:MAG: sigma-70 family RNA polymerase sigma factor [Opitutaceae bacterium]|nr:sigma-70 family RNA polymerase sigma factor [Opitutaceae bacterium]